MGSSSPETVDKVAAVASDTKDAVVDATKQGTSEFVKSARAFAAGGVGGICAVLTGHPFDLIKVNLQTAEKGAYNGAMDVVRQIIAKRGAAGLYAGVSAPLAGVTPMCRFHDVSASFKRLIVLQLRYPSGVTMLENRWSKSMALLKTVNSLQLKSQWLVSSRRYP
jgi:Mitochondrial carrier protein